MRISGFVEQLRFLNGANRKPWKISIHGFIRKDFENGAEVGRRKRAQNQPVGRKNRAEKSHMQSPHRDYTPQNVRMQTKKAECLKTPRAFYLIFNAITV